MLAKFVPSVTSKRSKKNVFKYHAVDKPFSDQYHATHHCFYSQRSLYVAVYNMKHEKKGLDELDPWLRNIKVHSLFLCHGKTRPRESLRVVYEVFKEPSRTVFVSKTAICILRVVLRVIHSSLGKRAICRLRQAPR